MYLNDIIIYHVSPCFAEAGKIRVKAKLTEDITEIMPYLNRVIRTVSYNPHAPNLTLFREFRMITLLPKEILLVKAVNTTDARQVLAWLKDLINDTVERMDEIEPFYETRKRPHPLQLYQWLPGSNCGQCGEKTCLAFAARLFAGQQKLEHCAPLFTSEYSEQREVFLQLAAALGYNVAAE